MVDIDYHDLNQSPPPSSSNVDPFYSAKEELQSDTRLLAVDREAWTSVLSRYDSPKDSQVARATRALKARVKRVEQQVKELSRTIDQVERQRARFPTIDDQELFTRKKFVSDVKAIAREARDALANRSIGRQKKAPTEMRSPAVSRSQVPLAQQMIEMEQDVHLDDMMSSLQRLGVMGQNIGEELEQQRVLLGELDEDMDETGTRMDVVMRKLDKLIGTSNRGRVYIILFLALLLVLLLFFIIYF